MAAELAGAGSRGMDGAMIHQDPIGDLQVWHARQGEIDRDVELRRLAKDGRPDRGTAPFIRRLPARGLLRAVAHFGGLLAPSPRGDASG